jgi:hypothetical protein
VVLSAKAQDQTGKSMELAIDRALYSDPSSPSVPSRSAQAVRFVLCATLAVMYGGISTMMARVNPLLLYGQYVLVMACVGALFLMDRAVLRNLTFILPAYWWISVYYFWGLLFAENQEIWFPEGLRNVIRFNLMLLGVAVCVRDRAGLQKFALLIQLPLLLNCAISVWESFNPSIIERIAYFLDPEATGFSLDRPAALWSNPNEAAFAYLFGLLMGNWVRSPVLRWTSRLAAILGIFLTVSRTGIYLSIVCALVFAVFKLRTARFTARTVTAVVTATFLLASTAVAGYVTALSFAQSAVEENRNLSRIFDFSESHTRTESQESRTELAGLALRYAMEGPWHGYGLYTFQDEKGHLFQSQTGQGAHDIYIAVFGEAGLGVLVGFVVVLVWGLSRCFTLPLAGRDRFQLFCLWIVFLVIGFTWHNQFTGFMGLIFFACLFLLPGLLAMDQRRRTVAPRLPQRRVLVGALHGSPV